MIAESTVSPRKAERTVAATSKIMIGLRNWRSSRIRSLAWRSAPSRFGPWTASRRRASGSARPADALSSSVNNSSASTDQNADGSMAPP